MAEDPVERAARIRKSLAETVKEVRGGDPSPVSAGAGEATKPDRAKKNANAEKAEKPGEAGRTDQQKAVHDRDVNALLDRTRAVIDHTRKVIEQTRANLQRLTRKDGGDTDAE